MNERVGDRTRVLAVVSAVAGMSVALWPIVQGLHSGWVILGLFVGGLLVVGALAMVSPTLPGEHPPDRRGG